MIELKLNAHQFNEIIKKGYDLNIIFLLKMIEGGYIFEEQLEGEPKSLKILNIEQSLYRKGLTTDIGELTLEGKEILEFLSKSDKPIKLVKKKPKDENFTLWWSHFPSLDSFTYKGKEFQGSRSLKAKKDDCKQKLHSILDEGDNKVSVDIIT